MLIQDAQTMLSIQRTHIDELRAQAAADRLSRSVPRRAGRRWPRLWPRRRPVGGPGRSAAALS
jgi:hypothetical protein